MEILVKHSFPSSTKLNWLLKALTTECQPRYTIYINLKWRKFRQAEACPELTNS